MTTILVSGNCQANVIADCLKLMLPDETVTLVEYGALVSPDFTLAPYLPTLRFVVAGDGGAKLFFETDAAVRAKGVPILSFPSIFFTGYHPDTVYAPMGGPARILSPTGTNHSALILNAFLKGQSEREARAAFNGRVFAHLGYDRHFETSSDFLLRQGAACGLDLSDALRTWSGRAPFLFTPNHPKLPVLAAISRMLVAKMGLTATVARPDEILHDRFKDMVVWPVYPEIARRFGIEGDYAFKVPDSGPHVRTILGLEAYIAACFRIYAAADPAALQFERLKDPRYAEVAAPSPSPTRHASANPYRGLDDRAFWKRSVQQPAMGDVDPAAGLELTIGIGDRVATAGSCFAQHIAQALRRNGFNFHLTDAEPPEGVRSELYAQGHAFSARYGNIYTSRQLLQLFDRAFGRAQPASASWRRADGRFLDRFRPQIVEGGFLSAEELLGDVERHLAAVRRMFTTLDVLVFTLGLTETWQSTRDGFVVPAAPATTGADADQGEYAFLNLDVDAVRSDLAAFRERLLGVNPGARLVLTVSPVPLIATGTGDHVLPATVYSKSVLRVAAAELAREPGVTYFPSYEIITGNFARGRYFEPDLRSVTKEGVDHVMTVFFRACGVRAAAAPRPAPRDDHAELRTGTGILCDEDLIEKSLAGRT